MVECVSPAPVRQSPPPITVEAGVRRSSELLPVGLRLAQQSDAQRLFDTCLDAYKENGFGGVDVDRVRTIIQQGIDRQHYVWAIIDGPERIEAVLGLQMCRLWYGTDHDWYWTELLFYVHPDHRQSRHALKLFRFADWWQRNIRMPVVIGVFPTQDLERKEALFSRYAKRAGSFWLFGDGVFRPLGTPQ